MSVIPTVLQTSAIDESQSVRVETVLLDADNHSWVPEQYGKTRFVLPKRGSVLAPNGRLIWKAGWSGEVAGADASATYPRDGGGHVAILQSWMYIGGKLVAHTDGAGSKAYIDSKMASWDQQCEIDDVLVGGHRQYNYSSNTARDLGGAVGCWEWNEDRKQTTAAVAAAPPTEATSRVRGARNVIATVAGTAGLECSIGLKALFPVLKDTLLPMALRGDVAIEIEWEGRFGSVMVEGGGGANTGAWAGARTGYEVFEPRLCLDYVSYAPDIDAALRESVMSGAGMMVPFRQAILVRSQMPALGAGAGVTQANDIELGFQGRSVMKVYAQKLQLNQDAAPAGGGFLPISGVNPMKKTLRSDGLNGEAIQLIVNNKAMYDRVVTLPSEMYSYFSQTAGTPAYFMPGGYGQVGRLANNAAQQCAAANPLASNAAPATPNTTVPFTDEFHQGRDRWLGFSMAQSRGGADTPSNAVKIGASPIILRINRANANGGSDETADDARTRSPVQVNVWCEAVAALVIRNGTVEVMAM